MLPKVTIFYTDSKAEHTLSLAVSKHAYEVHPGIYSLFNADILDEILLQTGQQSFEEALLENRNDWAICNSLKEQRDQIIRHFQGGDLIVEDGYKPMSIDDYEEVVSSIEYK